MSQTPDRPGTIPYLSADPAHIGVPAPVFRLPTAIRIGTVSLRVARLERSIAFYRDILGFRVLNEGPARADLGAPGIDTVLLSLHEKPDVRPVPKRGLLGLYHFAVLLPSRSDLGRFLVHAAGHQLRVASADHLISEALYVTDPDGITVEIYRDRSRAEWVVNDQGEILATVDPLDLHDLATAGGQEPYGGLPAGTTIGHMHFYVEDLEAATSFYHLGLGFDKVLWSFSGALFVSAGGYHHHVGLNVWAAGSPVTTVDDAGLISWELILPDAQTLDAAADSLRRTVHAVTTEENGYQAVDPWGIRVLLRSATV